MMVTQTLCRCPPQALAGFLALHVLRGSLGAGQLASHMPAMTLVEAGR